MDEVVREHDVVKPLQLFQSAEHRGLAVCRDADRSHLAHALGAADRIPVLQRALLDRAVADCECDSV